MEDLTHRSVLASAHLNVITEMFDDEMVVVDLDTGRYFSVDLIGGTIFQLLQDGFDLGGVIDTLASRYAGPRDAIDAQVAQFCETLVEAGLLRIAEGASSLVPNLSSVDDPPPFATPTLTAYTDMEDLLLLDPIHDVDETGWPARPGA